MYQRYNGRDLSGYLRAQQDLAKMAMHPKIKAALAEIQKKILDQSKGQREAGNPNGQIAKGQQTGS